MLREESINWGAFELGVLIKKWEGGLKKWTRKFDIRSSKNEAKYEGFGRRGWKGKN